MFGILVIVLVVMAAYGTEYVAKERSLKTATMIKVQNNNQVAALLGVNVLRQLDADGPSLTAVLAAAGIDGFSGLEIKGLRSNTAYQLHKDDLNQDLNLMFTERGTVNLCHKQALEAILVEDVSEINAVN